MHGALVWIVLAGYCVLLGLPLVVWLAMAPISRLDVIYGFGTLMPQFSSRIADDDPLTMSENYRAYLARDSAIQATLHD